MTVTSSPTEVATPAKGVEPGTPRLGPNPESIRAEVPFAMRDSEHVPAERYYSREFFELEKEKLWPHTWLMAARLEELPDPGDYVVFEIVGKSMLLVRQRDRSVKAMHNVCRHRATELATGSGRFPGGQMVCPFHGWRWNIDGSCSHVFGRNGFRPEVVEQDDVALPECQVELWGGHVWINMDLNAPPLREALFPVADLLDGMGVENMRVKWWKETILNCNWKIAQEAFFEGYHVMQTHPQLFLAERDEDDEILPYSSEYRMFVNGHGRFQSGDTKMSYGGRSFIKHMRLLADGQDAMTLERDMHIFEGLINKVDPDDPNFAMKAIDALYDYAKGAGIPMPEYDAVKMRLWGGDVFLFPNYLMLPMYGNCLAYRIRPHNDDPDWCRFEVWSLTTYPQGQEPGRVQLDGRFDKDDSDGWGLIPRQDFGNLERMQRGMKSPSFTETRLSHLWEQVISNMHEELDRRLAIEY